MLDPVLRGFVDAASEEEAQRHLAWLLHDRVRPLLGRIAAWKLGACGANPFRPEDLEDVVGDATLLLLKRLLELRTRPGMDAIESLDDYAAAVGYSVCAHRLRRRHPERSRLKNRLRRLLLRDTRFALWEIGDHGWCCGFSSWHGTAPGPFATEKLAHIEESAVDRDDTGPLLGRIFDRAGEAVELDRLVSLVASIRQLDRVPQVADATSVDQLPDTGSGADVSLEQRESTERLWAEIRQLPVRQRAALLLNLRDSHGAGMLWIFPVTGVASMRDIARALEMPTEELAELWGRLPIDDAALAARLGCTRQQVINLRMSARKRLGNRLGRPRASAGSLAPARSACFAGFPRESVAEALADRVIPPASTASTTTNDS